MEFSFRNREAALQRFRNETFDLLVIGGGITGAAVARDAGSRGLKVALVDQSDFAFGTSSRSSKLIHGGLRYLENFEFGLVFESLAERAFLLKAVPHMVKPLPFFLPVFKGDRNGRLLLSMGLYLYDLLALGRTPECHKNLSAQKFLKKVPFLKSEGLTGGFEYFDASMWDDVLTVETLRSAQDHGVAIANYVQAVAPQWTRDRISGFRLRDLEKTRGEGEIDLRAHRVVVCAGPWTDKVGAALSPQWRPWLIPSRGVHLVFDLKRIPVPGALVMNHPEDGRMSFVIPRPDFGTGVAIVGTTDGPSNPEPEKTAIEASDVHYLMDLLNRYLPSLKLSTSDILSGYVGVRPLIAPKVASHLDEPGKSAPLLQKVSREHHIGYGPGGTVVVAGGKYTTHRRMAEEIVDFALASWRKDAKAGKCAAFPSDIDRSRTREPLNLKMTQSAADECRAKIAAEGLSIPQELLDRYGAEALEILEIHSSLVVPGDADRDPDGFPLLSAQLRHAIRSGMVLHLEDFYFRRTALFMARADHGLPWAEMLGRVWAEEFGFDSVAEHAEVERLRQEIRKNTAWLQALRS